MKKIYIFYCFFWGLITNAQATTVSHEFNVQLGAFNASRCNFTYSITTSNYEISSSVQTAGFFDTLYPFKAEYSTTGKIKENKLETSSYRYQSQSRFNKRHKELIYDKNGKPIYRISSKNEKTKKVELDNSTNNKDTTDLQTVFAKLIIQYNHLKFCDSRMQVFDGKRRFDVLFKDEGKEALPQTSASSFSGVATKCSMYIDKLNSDEDDLLWQLTSERPVYIWIMQDKQTSKPFVAHIRIQDTPLGRLDVAATKINIKE